MAGGQDIYTMCIAHDALEREAFILERSPDRDHGPTQRWDVQTPLAQSPPSAQPTPSVQVAPAPAPLQVSLQDPQASEL